MNRGSATTLRCGIVTEHPTKPIDTVSITFSALYFRPENGCKQRSSYDSAMAEALDSLFKAELIDRRAQSSCTGTSTAWWRGVWQLKGSWYEKQWI